MPGLYRSKSVRRFEDSNSCLTSFIEKDNKKVLGAAAIQLFISTSTPHLEKWFKSSTGTICFLKDSSRKSTFYFRLYSLMQGQLWEQEIQAPFSYKKKSYLFHYLTVNRFNFGFKFICEDEAERFFNVISKFSLLDDINYESTCGLQNMDIFNDKMYSPLTQIEYAANRTSIREKEQHIHLNSLESNANLSPLSTYANRKSGRSILANQNQLTPTSIQTVQTSSTVNLKQSTNDNNIYSSSNQRLSRRVDGSVERRKKIEKRDISCPFRCSSIDIGIVQPHLNQIDQNNNYNNNNNNYNNNNSSSNVENHNKQGIVASTPTKSNENSNFVQKYSTIVKRALSSASAQTSSIYKQNSTNVNNNNNNNNNSNKENEDDTLNKKLTNKLIYGSTSSISKSSTSIKGSPNGQNINIKINQLTTLKNTESIVYNNNNHNDSNNMKKNSYVNSNIINQNALSKDILMKKEDVELEITKDILIKYNVPINKKLIKILREYMSQYGNVEEFKKAIESSEDERNRLNSFVAASSAAIINKSRIEPTETDSPSTKHKKYPPNISMMPPKNASSPLKPSPPVKQFSVASSTPSNGYNMITPASSQAKLAANVNGKQQSYRNYSVSLINNTPVSMKTTSQAIYHHHHQQQLERTPIRTNQIVYGGSHYSINNRVQTPSPSRHNQQQFRQNLATYSSITPTDANAPPKPPRRSSVKGN